MNFPNTIASYMSDAKQLRIHLDDFQKKCIDLSTGRGSETSYEDYEHSRANLLSQPELLPRLPHWVSSCRYGGQFWSLMKNTSSNYQGRREFIWESLSPVFDYVEQGFTEPSCMSLEALLSNCTSVSVVDCWRKIHVRRISDPEGTITIARSLVESTCKYILEELGESYTNKDDLPRLYKKTAHAMHLSPGQHNEQIFKQILSGCSSVIDGFAALRNDLGDAHGKGKIKSSPSARHADLAVNLAGTISTFLISTYEERYNKS